MHATVQQTRQPFATLSNCEVNFTSSYRLYETIIPASVCQAEGCAKTADWIEILLGVETPVDSINIVLDGCPHHRGQWKGSSMRPFQNYFVRPLVVMSVCNFSRLTRVLEAVCLPVCLCVGLVQYSGFQRR